MQFLDIPTARRLEAAEEVPQMEIARVLARTQPEIGAEILTIAGGHAIFAGLNSPIGRATGLGFDGPVTAAQLDQVEAFYVRHHAPAQVDITPLTDASLLELVKTRGYTIYELNNVMARRLSAGEHLEEHVQGIEFRDCTPDQTRLWGETMLRGFFPDGPPEGWLELVCPMAEVPHSLAMIAWDGDRPVAAVGGLISPEHRMVALGGTSTLPEYRGRRIQTAAIGRRLNRAMRQGCDLAVIVTQGNTTSQRNAERLGFTVAYSKATVGKNLS